MHIDVVYIQKNTFEDQVCTFNEVWFEMDDRIWSTYNLNNENTNKSESESESETESESQSESESENKNKDFY